ncbi:zf-HC2 domain-containing protein [Fodinicurvata sp. EGI_FJ10296]|uniref:anti-sigma factor family protein n=1 Tax=Fodinicurvata sp. EGI_FJ10296 TaxID=3231908 RepID=UPI0034568AB5
MAPEISCEEVIEQLMTYLDRELDETAEREIDAHLEACRGCFSRAEFERRLRARVVDTANVKAPAHLHNRVEALTRRF